MLRATICRCMTVAETVRVGPPGLGRRSPQDPAHVEHNDETPVERNLADGEAPLLIGGTRLPCHRSSIRSRLDPKAEGHSLTHHHIELGRAGRHLHLDPGELPEAVGLATRALTGRSFTTLRTDAAAALPSPAVVLSAWLNQ